jgi:mRNA interferase HigB
LRIITKKRIQQAQAKFSDSTASLEHWYLVTKAARWKTFSDLWESFPSADHVERRTVFNIAQNRYRLIARVSYVGQRVFVLHIMTHKEYERGEWKK